jgi:hypothetical protein
MKKTIISCIVFMSLIVFTVTVNAKNVGYMSAGRTYWGYGLNDFYMTQATSDVLAQGHTLISIDEFSPSSLTGMDVAFVGLGNSGIYGALPASEVTSLYNFVSGGGSLILFGENIYYDSFQNSVASAFGVSYNSDYYEGSFSYTCNTSHPIMQGPYGEVASYSIGLGGGGKIKDLGPYAVSLINEQRGDSVAAIIDNGVLCDGSGLVIFLTGVGGFKDDSRAVPEGYWNSALWNNIFAYSVPEPASLFLLGFGGLALRPKRNR